MYCDMGNEKVSSQSPVACIQDVSLWIIYFTILRLSRFVEPHLANYVVIYYLVSCMTPTIFYWCSSLFDIVQGQLMRCKTRRLKNFEFESLICSYFFERILGLSPQVQLPIAAPREPCMVCLCDLQLHLGGVPYHHRDARFYAWWYRCTYVVYDYAFKGMNFCGDLDLALPLGTQWRDIGMFFLFLLFYSYVFWRVCYFFVVVNAFVKKKLQISDLHIQQDCRYMFVLCGRMSRPCHSWMFLSVRLAGTSQGSLLMCR